jgi:4-hydroxy 2-oxovalerate aldolase
MAYANSISLINKGFNRPLVIDGALYGMGKSAGNACTELLAMYMNEFCSRNFNINQLQEAIDIDILKEFEKKSWGYNFEYYISALNDCHPSYVQYLLAKKTLSIKSINEILQTINQVKKLTYDKDLIERLYTEYQDRIAMTSRFVKHYDNYFSIKRFYYWARGRPYWKKQRLSIVLYKKTALLLFR